MNRLSETQLRLAQEVFALPEAADYALAGGAALVALGVVDRETRDLDAFVAARPGPQPGNVRPLVDAVCSSLEKNDWIVEVVRLHDTFARLLCAFQGSAVELDLAVDSPPLFPIELVGAIPTLAPPDLAARKVLAILDRLEPRDFGDLYRLSQTLGRDECIGFARALDSGITRSDLAAAFHRLARLSDEELPCQMEQCSDLRTWFDTWINMLLAGED